MILPATDRSEHKDQEDARRTSILVVEDFAHNATGHHPVRFYELSQGFLQIGCDVHVLTSRGFARAPEFRAANGFAGSYVFPATLFYFIGEKLSVFASFLENRHVFGSHRLAIKLWLFFRNISLALGVRAYVKSHPSRDLHVVIVSDGVRVEFFSILAPIKQYIVHVFLKPVENMPRWARHLARQSEERRRKSGGGMIISAPPGALSDAWRKQGVFQVESIPLAGARRISASAGAREGLGIDNTCRIALLYGEHHSDKRPFTAIKAIQEVQNWHLVIAGRIAAHVLSCLGDIRSDRITLLPNATSNAERDMWNSTADAVILSFADGYQRHSGTLMDAISAGRPVVVSDGCLAAHIVREFNIGVVFQPESAVDLARALAEVQLVPIGQTIKKAIEEFSNERVAARHVEAFERNRI